MFGPKARLLADLVGRSDHPKKAEILGPLNRVRGDTKRNEIAHGYLWSDDNRVRFIQRITSGEFQCRVLEFNYEQFKDHVLKLINDSTALYTALEIDYADINAFADAALSLNRKSKTSPVSPASKAE